jgi:RND family efflux transporter MFP subunit
MNAGWTKNQQKISMRYSESHPSKDLDTGESSEEKLRREVADLKRQLMEQRGIVQTLSHHKIWRPSAVTLWAIFLAIIAVIVFAFFAGYIPLQRRMAIVRSDALEQEQEQNVPRVEFAPVARSSNNAELQLPGSIQAITEAPILARADGYVSSRMVDIGDRVQSGQPLAEIDAPELDQQIVQARATLQQSQAALEQALANEEQGKANLELARITAQRWVDLSAKGLATRQEYDQYQAQYAAQTANVQALGKAVAAARSNIAATEANLARLNELKSYQVVKAPFDGVITLRNVDVGALVNSGNTMLYRIAQTGTLRLYVNCPQTYANDVHVGQRAQLTVSNLPGRNFTGTVARTANALDPTSRTLLVEVQVPNGDGALLPGMYAQVDLRSVRPDAPLLIPGDSLILRAEGPQVAIVRPDQTLHLTKVEIGRDYGDRMEIINGLHEGDRIVLNPGDTLREGEKVNPVQLPSKKNDK